MHKSLRDAIFPSKIDLGVPLHHVCKGCLNNVVVVIFNCFSQCIKAKLQTVAVLQKGRDVDLRKCNEDVMSFDVDACG